MDNQEERARELARSNYAAQMETLGYGPDGTPKNEKHRTWISVDDRLPENDRTVLAVKQLKDGRRDICIARCIPDYEHFDPDTRQKVRKPYWVCGGKNNIIFWMELPKIPEVP